MSGESFLGRLEGAAVAGSCFGKGLLRCRPRRSRRGGWGIGVRRWLGGSELLWASATVDRWSKVMGCDHMNGVPRLVTLCRF